MTDATKPPPKHTAHGNYARADWFEARCRTLEAELAKKYSLADISGLALNAVTRIKRLETVLQSLADEVGIAAARGIVLAINNGALIDAVEALAPAQRTPGWAEGGPFIFGKEQAV